MNNLDDFEAVFVKGETSPGVKVLLIGWYKEALESLVKLGCDEAQTSSMQNILSVRASTIKTLQS